MKSSRRILVLILIICARVMGAAAQGGISVERGNLTAKGAPIIVSIDAQGRLRLGKTAITRSRLQRKLDADLAGRIPPERIIYIKAGAKVPFSQLVKVLKLGREVKQDTFGLLAAGQDVTAAVMTKIVLDEPSDRDDSKPNPLTLVLAFKKIGGLSLNGESHTPLSLTTRLREIFKARADNGVFREGSNEVERTVFLKPSAATTFGAIVQAARLTRDAGAEPIGIQIDKPQQLIMQVIGDPIK